MNKLIFVIFFVASLAEAGDIKKWVDTKGNVHYGDRPPTGQSTEAVKVDGGSGNTIKMDKDFMLGKWRTDSVVHNGQTIPSIIHIFDKTSIKLEGQSMQLTVSGYSYSNGVVAVTFNGISQLYTIIDENTVSYTSLSFGKQLLHRMK